MIRAREKEEHTRPEGKKKMLFGWGGEVWGKKKRQANSIFLEPRARA